MGSRFLTLLVKFTWTGSALHDQCWGRFCICPSLISSEHLSKCSWTSFNSVPAFHNIVPNIMLNDFTSPQCMLSILVWANSAIVWLEYIKLSKCFSTVSITSIVDSWTVSTGSHAILLWSDTVFSGTVTGKFTGTFVDSWTVSTGAHIHNHLEFPHFPGHSLMVHPYSHCKLMAHIGCSHYRSFLYLLHFHTGHHWLYCHCCHLCPASSQWILQMVSWWGYAGLVVVL